MIFLDGEGNSKMKIFIDTVKVLWKTSKIYFVFTFLLSIGSALPNVLSLIVWQKILDSISNFYFYGAVNYKEIVMLIFIHFLLNIIANIIVKINEYIKNIYSLILEKYITNQAIEAVLQMSLAEMESAEFHDIIEKATSESSDKMIGILNKLVEMVQNITLFVGMSGILLSFNFGIYIIIFLSVLPMAIYSQKYFNKIYFIYNKRVEKIRFNNEIKNMIIRSDVFKEIKLFDSILFFKEKINQTMDDIIKEDKKVKGSLNRQGVLFQAVEVLFTYGLKTVIIITGIMDKKSIGVINMNMDSATQLQNATSNIVFIGMSLYEDCLYLSSYERLMEYKDKRIKENYVVNKNTIKNFEIETIRFENVWFKYKEDGDFILKGINLEFYINKSYAIVGYNGGGKSTLIKLILRLYCPQKGKILLNNQEIEKYDINEYWKKISAVFQDFVKYPFTVSENIAIGNIKYINNQAKIKKAARTSNADEFIESLSNKYDEKLTRGWKDSIDISIGQWQRLAIARANIRDGNLVIFDEPSAALDSRTENKILSNVMKSSNGKLSIIITHRFLNIKKVNEIIVLKSGEVEAVGTHKQLLESCHTYRDLYHAQKEMI